MEVNDFVSLLGKLFTLLRTSNILNELKIMQLCLKRMGKLLSNASCRSSQNEFCGKVKSVGASESLREIPLVLGQAKFAPPLLRGLGKVVALQRHQALKELFPDGSVRQSRSELVGPGSTGRCAGCPIAGQNTFL